MGDNKLNNTYKSKKDKSLAYMKLFRCFLYVINVQSDFINLPIWLFIATPLILIKFVMIGPEVHEKNCVISSCDKECLDCK